MKKIFTLCSIACLFALSAGAQPFAFYRDGKPVANNAEITVSNANLDEFEEWVFESGLSLKNLQNYPTTAHVVQTIVKYPLFFFDRERNTHGSLNFCLNACIEADSVVKWQERRIEAESLMSPPLFHLYYYPEIGNYTEIVVIYEVYPPSEPNNKTSVTVTYLYNENSMTSIPVFHSENAIKVIQEGKNVKFSYAFDAKDALLEVYDVTGKKLTQHYLNTQGTFTTEELPQGIYVCILKIKNDIIKIQKFAVR